MTIYSVTIAIEPAIEREWLQWMIEVHVPDVLRTRCFTECRCHKVIDSEGADVIYVLQYRCSTLADYHRYRDNFAPALQKEHTDRFAGKFRGSRKVMEEIAVIAAD